MFFNATDFKNGIASVILTKDNHFDSSIRANINEKGDIIEYQTKSETKKYKVTEIKKITETDIDVIRNTKENKITLITCVENKPLSFFLFVIIYCLFTIESLSRNITFIYRKL